MFEETKQKISDWCINHCRKIGWDLTIMPDGSVKVKGRNHHIYGTILVYKCYGTIITNPFMDATINIKIDASDTTEATDKLYDILRE